MRGGWPRNISIGEGFKNWTHGRWLSMGLSVLTGLAVLVPLCAELGYLERVLTDEQAWLDAGGSVLVARNESGISKDACERLNAVQGVRGAGAVSLAGAVRLTIQPEEPVSLIAVTPGLRRVTGTRGEPGGATLSSVLANEVGLRPDSLVAMNLASTTVSGGEEQRPQTRTSRPVILPALPIKVTAIDDLRVLAEEHQDGLLVEDVTGGYGDVCYVATNLNSREAVRDALPALLTPTSSATPTIVADRLVGGRFVRDYYGLWHDRATARSPWALGILAGCLWVLIRWIRRADDGLYESIGATRSTRVYIRTTEWFVLLVAGTLPALLTATGYGVAIGLGVTTTVAQVVPFGSIFAIAATSIHVLWTAAVPTPTLAQLKDR